MRFGANQASIALYKPGILFPVLDQSCRSSGAREANRLAQEEEDVAVERAQVHRWKMEPSAGNQVRLFMEIKAFFKKADYLILLSALPSSYFDLSVRWVGNS